MTRSTDFDRRALYAAIDAQRVARGLTWSQVMVEINNPLERPVRPIGRSTVSGLGDKAIAEGDGVLQMLRWLHRSPESFAAARAPPS